MLDKSFCHQTGQEKADIPIIMRQNRLQTKTNEKRQERTIHLIKRTVIKGDIANLNIYIINFGDPVY